MFPHMLQAREVKVPALDVTAAVVPHPSAHVQRSHAPRGVLPVLRLAQVEHAGGPLVLVLLLLLAKAQVSLNARPEGAGGLVRVGRQAPALLELLVFFVACRQGIIPSTVRVKQFAKDHLGLEVLLTLRPTRHLPLPPPPLGRLLPLPRLDGVFPHLHRPVGVVELLVEAAGVTYRRALLVASSPPEGRLVSPAVEALGVRPQSQVFLLQN